MKTYKGYYLKTEKQMTSIFYKGVLVGSTWSDENKNNSLEKAMFRIDNNRINNLK